jgi:hypothetical protein
LNRLFALALLLAVPVTFLAAQSDPFAAPGDKIVTGGDMAPDGHTEVQADLPASSGLRLKNVGGSDGSGLCVFTSINMAARFQNERRLWDFQKQMRQEAGGGYPGKVTKMIDKYGPGTPYIQYEGSDPSIIIQALKTGRIPCCTYDGHDPHYSGTIAHMICVVAFTGTDDSKDYVCVLDNNWIEENQLVWLRPSDFVKRWKGNGGGWVVILLNPGPPPVPKSAN